MGKKQQKSCQISSSSDLKQWNIRLFDKQRLKKNKPQLTV